MTQHHRTPPPAHQSVLGSGGEAGGAPARPPGAALDASALGRLRELDPLGQNQLLERVFSAFESSLLKMLPQLVEAERSGDLAAVRHVAHTLKSSSATVGAMALSRHCAAIETLARENSKNGLAELVDELLAESAAVRVGLQAVREGRA